MAKIGLKPKDVQQTLLKGEVTAVVMKSDDGSFAITRVKEESGPLVSVQGPMAHVQVGETVECRGRWKHHEKYGWSFRVTDVAVSETLSRAGLVHYLELLPGVGPVMAEKIVAKWGEQTLDVLDADPRRIREIKGISEKHLDGAVEAWEENRSQRKVMLFLNTHGVTSNRAAKIYKAYGKETEKVLRENPYQITALPMIGFKTADEIAIKLGFPLEGLQRIDAGITHLLETNENNGNVYDHISNLLRAAKDDLGIGNVGLVKERLTELNRKGRVVLDKMDYKNPRVYRREMYDLEKEVADLVANLVTTPPTLDRYNAKEIMGEDASLLTEDQWKAVDNVFKNRVSVLTGLPGSGKTFSLETLVEAMEKAGITYELAAPTGKAAKRMSEVIGKPAKTIHRLLKWSFETRDFTVDEDHPLTTEVLVIDETSMVDLHLASSVLKALGPRQHILFVGDKDQLPSVSAGKFLDDLIVSDEVAVTKLDQIFRQAARSRIIQNARRINAGKFPYTQDQPVLEIENQAEVIDDFFLVKRNDNALIVSTVVDFVKVRIPKWKKFDPIKDIQVYAPMRSGQVGLDALNIALQAALNPNGSPLNYKGFRVGDKIIQTKNNYDLDLMNGETGIITAMNKEAGTITLETADEMIEDISLDELYSFMLAYAISIHRSQGSQAKAVVIPMTTSHYVMLKRNLLYTAVTRAEELCVIVGMPKALAVAARTVDTEKRLSALAERIKDEVAKSPA